MHPATDPDTHDASAERRWALASGIAFALLAAWFSQQYFHNVVDDALISVRYAENLAQGRGVVFNPGERVEGYTNFLWMSVIAGLYWPTRALGIDLVHALIATNVLVAAAVVASVLSLARRLWPGRLAPALAAAGLTALDGGFGVWSVLGLEQHFVALWALLALHLAIGRRQRAWPLIGVCMAGIMLTRPDGGLFVVALLGSSALALLLRGRDSAPQLGAPPSWPALLTAAGVWLGIYALYFAWRYGYYGYALPNTFYLKVGGGKLDAWKRGVDYLHSFLVERWYVPVLAPLAILAVQRPVQRTLLLWVSAHVLYITYVGGDFYPGHRFFVAIVPALALLIGGVVAQLERAAQRITPRAQLVTLPLAAALIGAVAVRAFEVGPYRTEIERWGPAVERARRYMLWLRAHAAEDTSMVVGEIGTAGHYAGLRVYDYYGVIDPVIAHQRVETLGHAKPGHEKYGSKEYFLGKHPTWIKWGYLPGDLYASGYYVRGDMPLSLEVTGLWELDPLRSSGRFDEASALHFDQPDPACETTGEAFRDWPRHGAARFQDPVEGQHAGYVSSFDWKLGDAATGTFRTPPFTAVGDQLTLRVAGGHDPARLTVELSVDGQRIASFTGRNSEVFTRSIVDIRPYRGKQIVLQAHDFATGAWGHIMFDEVEQWIADAR